MLVLTRRLGESIRIGDDIEVFVTELHGNQVKLGIKAPRDVKIIREELLAPTDPDDHRSAAAEG